MNPGDRQPPQLPRALRWTLIGLAVTSLACCAWASGFTDLIYTALT